MLIEIVSFLPFACGIRQDAHVGLHGNGFFSLVVYRKQKQVSLG